MISALERLLVNIFDRKIYPGSLLVVDHESELEIGRQCILWVLETRNLNFQPICAKIEPVTVRSSYGCIELVEMSYIAAKNLGISM